MFPRKIVFMIGISLLCLGCQSINRTASQVQIPPGLVIFTFDDGPNAHEDTTLRVLEVLRKYQIQALFALLGENAEYHPELVQRIHQEGHYIINHGYSEHHGVYLKPEAFSANLIQGQGAITAALGEDLPLLYRPHGGFYTKKQQRLWEDRGFVLLPGTARAYDAVLTAGERKTVVDRIVKAVESQKGGIILLHDARDGQRRLEAQVAKNPDSVFNRSYIPGVVEEIILILQEKGYTLRGFDIPALLGFQRQQGIDIYKEIN